ncbi:DsbA family protein [Candidatus Roizmanbacteria bacterium]|nr:DsbA family protein [Candidatus Roizmanbacteria bacterium]
MFDIFFLMNSQYITTYKEEEKSEPPNIQLILLIIIMIFSGYLYMKVKALERRTVSALTTNTTQQIVTSVPNSPTLTPPTPQTYDAIPSVTSKDHVRGNINAKIVLVEYSDLECPFCKKFHQTMKQVLKEYGDKVAWVYRHYPLSFHENAQKEAEASECAADQGGSITFWNYVDELLDRTTSNGKGFALNKLVPLAEELGLDGKKFKACLDNGTYEQKVKKGVEDAEKAGKLGTPTMIIIPSTGKRSIIPGALSFDEIKKQLDQILK